MFKAYLQIFCKYFVNTFAELGALFITQTLKSAAKCGIINIDFLSEVFSSFPENFFEKSCNVSRFALSNKRTGKS